MSMIFIVKTLLIVQPVTDWTIVDDAIIEFLPMTNTINKLIMTYEDARAIQKESMMMLYENGLVKVIQGITTLEEVLRVTSEN